MPGHGTRGLAALLAPICVLLAAGCLKVETPTSLAEKTPPGATVSSFGDAGGEGETRFYTFKADRPYRIEFKIRKSDVEAAEGLLKNIDREGLSNGEGRLFGLDRHDGNFLLQYWRCIYNSMYLQNRQVIARLAAVFRKIKTDNGLNDLQTIYVIARFVQFMKYYIPPGIGIYSPARVLLERGKGTEGEPPSGSETGWNGAGDCDTKSLLMAILLRECGYPAVVMDSYRYHHAMAAVSFPGIDGTAVEYRGRSYYMIESTYPAWNVGQMPPHYTDLSYFLPIDPSENQPGVDRAVKGAAAPSEDMLPREGPSEREPNNERDSADKVSELSLEGRLTEDDPCDWYLLGGQEGTFAAFTIIHDPSCDFNFEVFSDGASAGHARAAGTDTISCNIPGRCEVRVYRVSGSGPYTVIITPGGSSEKEPNDDAGDAGQVTTPSIFGDLESPGDVDWYTLGGQEGFNATYTIYHDRANDFNLEVLNDGVSVGSATGGQPGDSITVEHPGRVSVRIWSVRGSGWYLVRINKNR